MVKIRDRSAKLLRTAIFRANPAFELVVFDRLPEEYRRELAHLADEPDTYGVLWPKGPGLTVKAVDRETALLCFTLQAPGTLPAYVRTVLGDELEESILQLVLDEVLEIEIDGDLVSGAAAHRYLSPERAHGAAEGRIAEISRSALDYAAHLEIDSGRQLALWLYHYNAIPISPSWRRRLGNDDQVLRFLSLRNGSALDRLLDRFWIEATPDDGTRGWRSWSRRSLPRDSSGDPGYKLYFSPLPESLPQTLPALIEHLSNSRAVAFKLGRDLAGLLRPDKLVAYFDDFEALAEAAGALQSALGTVAAQGVPFSATIDAQGLFSWGMDPPLRQATGKERESWRLWVIHRLATALLAARTGGTSDPAAYALERIEMEGVNTSTWTPRQTLWEAARS